MLKKDKYKLVVLVLLLLVLGSTYFFTEKDATLMQYMSLSCLVIWLGAMFFINKKIK